MTNDYVACFCRGGLPAAVLVLQEKSKVHLWVAASLVPPAAKMSGDHEERRRGFDKDGVAITTGEPGYHSGVDAFFKDLNLVDFLPKSLDRAWEIIEALA